MEWVSRPSRTTDRLPYGHRQGLDLQRAADVVELNGHLRVERVVDHTRPRHDAGGGRACVEWGRVHEGIEE